MRLIRPTPHPDIEGKFTCSDCGHGADGGRARQVINRHIKRHHTEKFEPKAQSSEESESDDGPMYANATAPEDIPIEPAEPVWMKIDETEEGDVKPGRLKGITGRFARALNESGKGDGKPLPRETQQAVAAFCWRGVDTLYTKWGQAVKQDPEFKVQHSDDELEIIAAATVNSLEHHDVDVSKFLNPDLTLALLVGIYYGPPTVEISMTRSTRVKTWLQRIPLIGRLFGRKPKKGVTDDVNSDERPTQ